MKTRLSLFVGATGRISFHWLSDSRNIPGADYGLNADVFDDWILLSPEKIGVPTAVESSTWGRIKSTFR